MNSVCASAVQSEAQRNEQQDLARADRPERPRRRQGKGQQHERGEEVLPERDVRCRARGRPPAIHHGEQREREIRTTSPSARPWTTRFASENSGTSSDESGGDERGGRPLAPAQAARRQHALERAA